MAGASFPLTDLADLSLARQRNVLRWWLQQNRVAAPSAAVLEQLRLLHLAAVDSQARVEWGGYAARLYRGALYLASREAFQPWQGDVLWLEGAPPPTLPQWPGSKAGGERDIWMLRTAGDRQRRA